MSDNDEIAKELRAENLKKRQAAAPKVQTHHVLWARWVWTIGVVLIDLLTGYAISQVSVLFYALTWVLSGAGGLLWSEFISERVGNNPDQRKIGETGITVSAIGVFVMALAAGSVWVLGLRSNGSVE